MKPPRWINGLLRRGWAALVVLACVPAWADTAAVTPSAPRWSGTALGINALPQIPDALQRPFDSAFRATRPAGSTPGEVTIDNCRSWQTWRGQITGTQPEADHAALRGQGVQCDALALVAKVQPAQHTALPADLNRLLDTRLYPSTLWLAASDEALAQLARPGQTLASVSHRARWQNQPKGLLLDDGQAAVRLVWLARGDFNGDGWEDALYRWQAWQHGGSWTDVRLVLLTRRQPSAPLVELPVTVR